MGLGEIEGCEGWDVEHKGAFGSFLRWQILYTSCLLFLHYLFPLNLCEISSDKYISQRCMTPQVFALLSIIFLAPVSIIDTLRGLQ